MFHSNSEMSVNFVKQRLCCIYCCRGWRDDG